MELLGTLEAVLNKSIIAPVLRRAGRYSPKAYPFGNPVSVERCHIPIILARKYWITEKTDGTRVCLIFTETDKGVATSLLLDRVGNVYGFPVSCDSELFRGSVFDAELVQVDNGVYAMYIFDVAMLEGEVLGAGVPLSERLELIADVVHHTDVGIPNLTLHAKRMFPLQDMDAFKMHCAANGHVSDGYILTPDKDQAPLPGTAWSVFKIKTSHTIDLQWVDGVLWYGSGDELLRVDGLPDWSVRLESDMKPYASGSIIEFDVCISEDGKTLLLRAKCARPDKTAPNNALCLVRTVGSIRDAVTLADVTLPQLSSAAARPLA